MRYAIASLTVLFSIATFTPAAMAAPAVFITSTSGTETVVQGSDDAPMGELCFYSLGIDRELEAFHARILGDDAFDPNTGPVNDLFVHDAVMWCSLYNGYTQLEGPEPVDLYGFIGFSPYIELPAWQNICLQIECDLSHQMIENNDADTYGIIARHPGQFEIVRADNGDAVPNQKIKLPGKVNGKLNGDFAYNLEVVNHGNLVVTFNGPSASDMYQGENDVNIATYEICADDLESFWTDELTLAVDQTHLGTIGSITIEYEDWYGNVSTNTTYPFDGTAQFQNLGLFVEQDYCSLVDIYIDVDNMAPIGSMIWIGLNANDLDFVGWTSGMMVTEAVPYNTIASNAFTVVESQP
jgi:hypothetical protein